MRPATDDDFVIWRSAPYGQVLMLPSRRLVRPAADDDFVIWRTMFLWVKLHWETKRKKLGSLEGTSRSCGKIRSHKALNGTCFSQVYLEGIACCASTLSWKGNSGSVLYCTKEVCIKWSVRASLFVIVLSWYYLNVTLFILSQNKWHWFLFLLYHFVDASVNFVDLYCLHEKVTI